MATCPIMVTEHMPAHVMAAFARPRPLIELPLPIVIDATVMMFPYIADAAPRVALEPTDQ